MKQIGINPLVTIIIATYNRAKLLKRAIESVIAQTYTNWELIIVDDGSTDKTFQLVDKFFPKISNLKYIKQHNSKLWSARNIGIKLASGDYITFLDSDDMYKKNHLKLRVNFMSANPDYDLLYGGFKIIGDAFVPDKYDKRRKIHINKCVVGATFFGKRKVFKLLKGFKDIDYSEDSEFFERADKRFKVAKVNYPTYVYARTSKKSITRDI